MKGHPHSIVGIFLLSVLLVINSPAVITVNGIADQEIENDQASFPVPSEAGFTIVAQLNGTPVVLDANPVISIPGNYEPGVSKRNDSDASEESITIQLIALDSARGTSERGLINWIPSPTTIWRPKHLWAWECRSSPRPPCPWGSKFRTWCGSSIRDRVADCASMGGWRCLA